MGSPGESLNDGECFLRIPRIAGARCPHCRKPFLMVAVATAKAFERKWNALCEKHCKECHAHAH